MGRTAIKLVDDEDTLLRHVKSPSYKRHEIFDVDFVGIEKRRRVVYLDRPIYVGVAVLDLSKREMYRFHYEHMLSKYGPERLRLLMTDTDSLIYRVQTENIYDDMLDDKDLYDTSNYPPTHRLFSRENCKRLGKMKDEMGGRPIRSFVGLRSKMYSLETLDPSTDVRRAKGVPRQFVVDNIQHCDYMAALLASCVFEVNTRRICSIGHQVATIEQSRRALCALDDKRYVRDNGVETFAHGHHLIPIDRLLHELCDTVARSIGNSNGEEERLASNDVSNVFCCCARNQRSLDKNTNNTPDVNDGCSELVFDI